MKGFGDMMKQAQRMKAELERIQEEAAEKRVEGSAGGGMVTVTADGRGEIVHKPGEQWVEGTDVVHWSENRRVETAVLINVEVFQVR